jgi:hypothetical protein
MKDLPIDRNKCMRQERDEDLSKSYFKCSNECGFFGLDNNAGIHVFFLELLRFIFHECYNSFNWL